MKKVFAAYCLLICFSLRAQRKDTVLLNEVTVTDYRSKNVRDNFASVAIDSANRSAFVTSSLASLLLQQNTCFVKSYGPANIASLSVRGSTAQQTAVLWNGLNINNPMLGQTDISLVPAGLFDQATLQKGALSGYWGSGAMAGVLNLRSSVPEQEGISIRASTSYSSMKNVSQWIAVGFNKKNWSSSTKIFADGSKNQYSYYNADSVIRTQTHAKTNQFALMQDVSYKISAGQQLGMHFWLQDAQRQVPYSLSEIAQDASQHDRIVRALLDWKLNRHNYSIAARTAFFDEALIYTNRTYSVYSNSRFQTYMADVEAQRYLPKGFTITAGSTNAVSNGSSEGYSGQKQLSRIAFYENVSWKSKRFGATFYGREELFNFSTFIPTGGLAANLQLAKWLSWKANAGTVFRYPTLNDLYWNPGGNPNLKPEQGFSEESSLEINVQMGKFFFTSTGTIFSRRIHNWILWMPGRNAIWSPQNVLEVWSRGAESNSRLAYQARNCKVSLQVLTNYVLSSPEKTVLQNDESKGKQLPYVPMYSGSGVFMLEYKGWSVRSLLTYTGYRYLTSDNYDYLQPYQILDLRLAKTFSAKNLLLNIFAEANNVLNENYQSVAQYPMPLRNYRAGIIIQYQKTNKPQTL
jgi:iron complex outermembrane receptor protein